MDDFKVKPDAEGFELGSSAMFTRESWVVGDIKEHVPNLEYDAALIPGYKRNGTICNQANFYVSKNCKNPKVAWDFVMFMLKPEYQKLLLSKIGWFPSRLGNYEDIFKDVPQYRAFVDLPKGYNLYAYPHLSCIDEIYTRLADHLVNWYMDPSLQKDPKKLNAAISAAAKETDDILKENGVYAKK